MRTVELLAIAALGAACARERLTDSHGRATREIFARQLENPAAPRGPLPAALKGLDSQEATVVADDYLKSLAPKGEHVEEPQMLVVTPQKNDRQRPLAPSVPTK